MPFLGEVGYYERGSYLESAIPQHFPCDQCEKVKLSLLLPLAKVTLSRKVFTTPGSLRNHTKIHTGATSCPVCSRQLATVSSLNRHMKSEHRDALDALWIKVLFQTQCLSGFCSQASEWIDDVWLFRLLLEPLPAGFWGDHWPATYLSNLPQLVWQQGRPGQPPTVPRGQDQLSILWQHLLQHIQLEQACEEASYWCIADRLLSIFESMSVDVLRNIYFDLSWPFKRFYNPIKALHLPLSKLWPQATPGTLKLDSRRSSARSALSGSQARMPSQSTYLFTRARRNVNTARLHSLPFPTSTSTWESITVTWMCWPITMIRKCTSEAENKASNIHSFNSFPFWFNFSFRRRRLVCRGSSVSHPVWSVLQGVHQQECLHQPPALPRGQNHMQALWQILFKPLKP